MLGVLTILRHILASFTFWWPLFLSLKALKTPDQNVQFLLTYWLFYACISNVQFHVQGSEIPFSSVLLLAGDVLHIWMFYSHGCLVAMYCYIPSFINPSTVVSIVDSVDVKVLDPLVTVFWVNNVFVQNSLRAVSSTIPPLDDLLLFNRNLCEHYASSPRLTFLQYSLEYFCYIDSASELRARYVKSRGVLSRIGSSIPSLPSSAGSSRSSSGAKRVPSIKRDHAWRSAPQSKLSSRNVSSKELHSMSPQFHALPEHLDMSMFQSRHADEEEYEGNYGTRVPSSPTHSTFENHEEPLFGSNIGSPRNASGGMKIHVKKRTRARASSCTSADPPYPVRS